MDEKVQKDLKGIISLIESKLISTGLNYKEGNFRECISALYFAYEGLIRYILVLKEYYPESQEGIEVLKHFVDEGEISKKTYNNFTELYLRRKDADYHGFLSFDKNTVDEYLQLFSQSFSEMKDSFKKEHFDKINNAGKFFLEL